MFLPPGPDNALRAWRACEAVGLELWCGEGPLERPRDAWLAGRIVDRRALVRAEQAGFRADLTLVMAGSEFEAVWRVRRPVMPLPLEWSA